MLTEAANAQNEGVFSDFSLSEEDRYELYVASWMHDCGKVVTLEYVVDKQQNWKPSPILFTKYERDSKS